MRNNGDDTKSRSVGPCACGSALPATLCCQPRREFAAETSPTFVPGDDADTAAAQWELAVATIQALATVLPDVPVPLLGNQTPRALHAAGPEERSAALEYAQSVARTAITVGVVFPSDTLREEMARAAPECYSSSDRQNQALAMFTLQLLARGVDEAAVLGAHRLFRDVKRAVDPDFRKPEACAAAVDYAICWMHFRPETRQEIAEIYGVSDTTVAKRFARMKRDLKLVWYDPRYAVQDPAWQEMLERHAQAIANGEDAEASLEP